MPERKGIFYYAVRGEEVWDPKLSFYEYLSVSFLYNTD